jgi:rhodanese-related sulfurtransferase
MRNWIVAALFIAAGVVAAKAQEPELATAPRISMAEFKSLYTANKVLIVDVRDELSFGGGHIMGARSIPLGQLLDPRSIAALKQSRKEIVLYCA